MNNIITLTDCIIECCELSAVEEIELELIVLRSRVNNQFSPKTRLQVFIDKSLCNNVLILSLKSC